MISMEITADQGHVRLRMDFPDQPGTHFRLDELAAFALHLDIVKQRIVELMSKALSKSDGYELVIND